ncbi:MAG TPA: hypothetical protein VF131_18485 [Blastocatellia bacterium]|nr:hypothetical protein [Blastocatellia bacterium]
MRRITLFTMLFAAVAIFGTACIRKVTVAEVLPTQPQMATEELIARIDSYGRVDTFSAQAGFLVRNYFTGKENKAEEFPEANGAIRFRRPENIRMLVTAPIVNTKVADMASDGQSFRLAIYYPKDKRQFVHGSNLSDLDRMTTDELKKTKDPRLAEAGGLINMRPQHVTDAFLIKPTPASGRADVFREEVLMEEPDDRPGKKGRKVVRSYYVVYVLERTDKGESELRRKFWFDRTRHGTPLVRQQTFENGAGRLASDVWYSDWFKVNDTSWEWPGRVVVDRRQDGYRIELTLEKDSVEINSELPGTTFVLENTEGLKDVDLDAPRKASLTNDRKPQPSLPTH